jgi:hypothetical protein
LENAAEATLGVKIIPVWIAFAAFAAIAYAGSLEIRGPYANRLSKADLEQIKSVVSKERAVNHTLKKIEAVAADKVHIQSGGRFAVDQDKYYEFDVYKRAGAWAIDLNSIQISIEQRDLRTNGPAVIR